MNMDMDMNISIKKNNKYNNIISKITKKPKSKECKIKTAKNITIGLSGDKVRIINCENGLKYVEKSAIYDHIPSSTEFLKRLVLKNKYSLLRELIINLYLKSNPVIPQFYPKLLDWNIYPMENGKTKVEIKYEYIDGISIQELLNKNSYQGQTIIKTKETYVNLFLDLLNNLYLLYSKHGIVYNDIKIDNMIVQIDKNMNPRIVLLDFGRSTLPNLPLKSLKAILTEFSWNLYPFRKLIGKSREYNDRKIINILKNSNKSHKIKKDLKFIIVTIIIGYRKLFEDKKAVLINKEDIRKMKKMDFGAQIQYVMTKINHLLKL